MQHRWKQKKCSIAQHLFYKHFWSRTNFMQHDTTTCNMIQQHTTRWSNGTNFFFTTNVACCCMKSWDRLTGALLSSWKYFATFSIICCSSTIIDFPFFRLEHPGSGEMMSAIFQSTQKASLQGLGPHFIIDDINYQIITSSVYVANRGHYYARLIKFIFTWLLLIE